MICNNMPDGCPHPDYCEFHGTCRCTPIKVGREFIRMAERCGEMTPHPPPTPEECEDVKSVQKSSYSTSPFFSNQTGKVGREFIGRLHQIPGADELTRMAQEDGLYGGEE